MKQIKEKIEKVKNIKDNMTPTKVLISSLVLVALLSVIGLSWAWFSALNTGGDLQGVTVETANLSIVYNSGAEYEANNILPGWSGSKSFTVTNTGDRDATYSIVWENFTNTFNNKSDIVYSITSTNDGGTLAETQLPISGTNIGIISNVTIPTDTTQTYTITFRYINRTSTQNDQGSLIRGKIIINEEAVPTTNYAYVVTETTMNIGSQIPAGVNARQTPAEAMADWAAITGETNDTKPLYLKHKLNGSNEIEESYVCFERNNTQYCLKGSDSGASFVDNAKIIYDAYGGDRCLLDGNLGGNPYTTTPTSYFNCSVSGLTVTAKSNGEVTAVIDYYGCGASHYGSSYCS